MSRQHRFVKPTKQVNSKTEGIRPSRNNKSFMNNVLCGLCYNVLEHGKFLPCFHTFCSSCLNRRWTESQSVEGSITCPLCLHTAEIPFGVSGLRDNVYPEAQKLCNQTKENCQLCESRDTPAAVKCLDCQDAMCIDCKLVHLKQKTSKKHRIVFIAELQQQMKSSMPGNEKCPKHSGNGVFVFCMACNAAVCSLCHKMERPTHDCIELSVKTTEARDKLTKIIEGIRSYLPYVKSNANKAEKEIEALKTNVEETKSKMEHHKNTLFYMIEEIYAEKLKQLDVIFNSTLHQLETFKINMERVFISVRTLTQTTEQILQFAPETEIINIESSLSNRLQNVPKEIPRCSLDSNKVDFHSLPTDFVESFGTISTSEIPILEFSPSDTKVPTFYCPGRPYSICPSEDGDKAWVICDTPETIHLYQDNGDIERIVKLPGEVNDICRLSSDALLVTELRGRAIWKVGSDFTVSTYTTLPEAVRGIRTFEDYLYVTRRDGTGQGLCVLSLKTGDVLRDIREDKTGQSLFVHPDRVAVTSMGVIIVSDRGTEGALKFLSPDGHLVATYLGQPQDGNSDRFEPWGVCTDAEDRVFVTDRYNDCVHLLTASGGFVKHILSHDDGIRRPIGIATDIKGRLWVGNEDGSIKVFKYLEIL